MKKVFLGFQKNCGRHGSRGRGECLKSEKGKKVFFDFFKNYGRCGSHGSYGRGGCLKSEKKKK